MPSNALLSLGPQNSARLARFVGSELFNCRSSDIAKSSYWQYHSGQMLAEIGQAGTVRVSGESGFYIPSPGSFGKRLLNRVGRGLKQPSLVANAIRERFQARFGVPRLMSYYDAFDAAMSHARVSDPDLSPWRVNHLRLSQVPNVFATSASVAKHYELWSSYAATPSILNHYYDQNLMRGFIAGAELRTILEIGAGNGNFPSIFFHDWSPVRIILVDLPETIAIAFTFLANLFPKARLALPHELEQGLPDQFDFAFLTIDQLDVVKSDSVDLAINCHSFQEMTQRQIAIYFEFIQRVCRDHGFFFTANRVEKIPCGPDSYVREQTEPPNRFPEYPWNPSNEILIYETSRLLRLVQLDDVGLRLERIRK
jgi:putative sugar O-methyltransferase